MDRLPKGDSTVTYNTQTPPDARGRTETKTDIRRFAADLARELGGELLPQKYDWSDANDRIAHIKLGNDELALHGNSYGDKGRVSVSIDAPEINHDDRSSYDKSHKTESAKVNPDGRPIASIAKDIRKRVIDASAAALAAKRQYAADKIATRGGLDAQIAKLGKDIPGIQVSKRNASDLQASVSTYRINNGTYVDGRLNADGSVSIDRMSTVSPEQFRAIVAVLQKRAK